MSTSLERRLGVAGIVLMVVAAAAPLTVVAANFPIMLTVSGSVGLPVLMLTATVVLLLFSVGYAWMTPYVPDAGAFYSYVDRGLGRRAGVGTAAVALLAYLLLTVSMVAYLGVQAGNLIEHWTSLRLPWWLVSAVMLGVVAFLGYRDIELSAKVLGVFLLLEVAVIVSLDLGILLSGRQVSSAPWAPARALAGNPAMGLLFSFLGFMGFEATAVFRNEARDPERTIPRATYAAVLTVGALYTVSSWLVISGLGVSDAVEKATVGTDHAVLDLVREVLGPVLADVAQVLLVTSMFACMLAFHNIVTRYLFTLGGRGVLPARLAEVHEVHRAPSYASVWVSVLCSLSIAVSALARLDPVMQIFTWYSGAGALGVLAMMALTSVAVLTFARRGTRPGHAPAGAAVLAATVLGAVGLVAVLVISVLNLEFLVGSATAAFVWGAALAGAFLLGLALPPSTHRTP